MTRTAEPAVVRLGDPANRVDAQAKVTGAARYGSDPEVARPVFAFLAVSPIARGQITRIDDRQARAVPGVLDILTHENMRGEVRPVKFISDGGYMGSSIMPLSSPKVLHAGQIVAVVVADSFEAARDGAHRLAISYAEETPSPGFDSEGVEVVAGASASKEHQDPKVGDAEATFAAAPVKIDARYSTPTQHHNPIELFTTTCDWDGDKLTLWESSQNVHSFKNGLAQQLGIAAENVRVISPYIGGAFGSRGSLTQRSALIAVAAKRLGRPVKLVASRDQGFTIASYRAETRHRIRIGADQDGKLQSLSHEGFEVTSRPDPYMVSGTDASTRLYACPNVASSVSIVHADRSTPGFMRAPPEVPYLFPLESAMDELAVALRMDPIELRRVNDTKTEPIKGLPYTSRSLMACFDEGAKAFDWGRRNPQPGSMRDGDWLIGLGCAASMYPTQMGAATARVTLTISGTAKVQTAAHDIGTGAYTVIGMIAAERLGVPLEKVDVQLGDSDLPPAPGAGGSNTTASVCNVVAKACDEIRARIANAAVASQDSNLKAQDPKALRLSGGRLIGPDGDGEELQTAMRRVSNGAIEAYAENAPHGVRPDAIERLYRGSQTLAGGAKLQDRIQFAFGAEFVELRVHRLTREIRCPRVLGAFAAGRIMNMKTASSQLMGGLIWGVSSALFESTEMDRRQARFYNTDLAEYLVPVNADILAAEVIIIPEEDHEVNELGIKGIGELGNVGTNAAVANALFHATGVRIRNLPIRLEQLLGAESI